MSMSFPFADMTLGALYYDLVKNTSCFFIPISRRDGKVLPVTRLAYVARE